MPTNPSSATGQAPQARRAAEIEGAIRQVSVRFPDVAVPETLILRLVMLLGRRIGGLLEESLKAHNLNDTDFRILMCLVSQPDGVACPSDLCAFVAQSPANMTRVADALHERGLITRTASEHDRRRTMLRITPSGEALVCSLMPTTSVLTRSIFGDMTDDARQDLLDHLRRLTAQIERLEPSR
ncbi:MAG TPA: MarR family transcriptional regulator [Steroidobacteraceae bacterium]|jgi:MarR family transcriptional repressor of emrRAB|nr:MarR family transcriptional regulator [Steroidobacteraceae bacterium]